MDATRTVLIIDDDRDNADICSALLRHFGYEVLHADSLHAGLAMARVTRPGVVITELFERTGEGWAVLDALRSGPETAAIPVIVLSARVLPADRAAASAATVFLAKPVYPTEVLGHVRRCCGSPG